MLKTHACVGTLALQRRTTAMLSQPSGAAVSEVFRGSKTATRRPCVEKVRLHFVAQCGLEHPAPRLSHLNAQWVLADHDRVGIREDR